ncbi:MAG: hypothetical protein J0M08_04705 [Bacteroidetes bacterium]|nr:hypothetical protein [Bacteroidota bacterium]
MLPALIGFIYFLRTSKKDKSIGIGALFLLTGFLGLLGSTFIVKTKASGELDKNGLKTKGVVDYVYTSRSGSKSVKIRYEFLVKFNVGNQIYYSLPGITDDEIYFEGDTIDVTYLERNPFLNRISYKKE